MANNRMYLINKRTGEEVFIGRYYPEPGWYVFDPETLSQKIDEAFHKVDFGEISFDEAQRKRLSASGGLFGDRSWMIKYEIAE